jgi:PAS domain S-box-containing protein
MAVHVLGFMASNPIEIASVVGFGSFTWLLGILEPAVAGYALRLYRKLGERIAWWVFATFSLLALGHFLHASGATSRVIDSPVSSNIVALLIPFLLLIGMAHTESTVIDHSRKKRKEPEPRVQNDPHAQKRIADLIQQTDGLREQVVRLAEREKNLQQREKDLENCAQQYYLLFTNNPQPMWVFDLRSLQILAANDAAQVQYGFTQQEFLARTARDLLPAQETEAFLADVGRPAPDGQSRRVWHQRHKDGSTFEVEVRAIDLKYADCAARLILASDSTHGEVGGSMLQQEEKLEVISGVVGAVAPATAVQPASAPSGPKTILLVEPDARMRTMMRTVLEWNRYRVVETDSPSLAMTVWPSQSKHVDLLLTDVTLPGAVSGRQLAEQLRRDKPSMKVLYTYDSSKRPDGLEQLKAQELVAKPFTSVELLESISRCIH